MFQTTNQKQFFEKHSYETNMQSLELKNMYWLQTHMAFGAQKDWSFWPTDTRICSPQPKLCCIMCFSYDKVVHCSPWRLNVPGVFLPCLSPWNKIHVPQQTYHPQNKRYILQKHPNFIPLRSWDSHTSIAFTHKNMYSTSRSLAPLQHLDEQTRPSPASLVANR